MLLKTTVLILSFALTTSTTFAGSLDTQTIEAKIKEQKKQAAQDDEMALINDAIVNYNSVASKDKKIIDADLQIVVDPTWGGQTLHPSALLRDGTECVAKVYKSNAFAVSNTGMWSFSLGGMSEVPYNNQYYSMELNCTGEQILALVKTVDGKDALDNLNPGQNSGAVTYSIKKLDTNL